MNDLVLLPQPRSLTATDGRYPLAPGRRIVIRAADPTALRFAALRLQTALREHAAVDWELSASDAGPADALGITLELAPDRDWGQDGYELRITPEGIRAASGTPAGIFYAVCTLIQILGQTAPELPCLEITDSADFGARGVMLDISRDKVPTMETLRALIDRLAGWKINQLQLYTEHTFAYQAHPDVWASASPITGAEILELDAFCRERFIELVPNQNSFGHMNRWLIHERYAPLAEVTDGFRTPWGTEEGPFSLAPLDPGSIQLVSSLFDELVPHFGSRMVNVGCDETFDLGQGRSQAAVAEHGSGRVYLDFLLKIYADIAARGRTMQFWGDIIVQHPELIPELPKDTIALAWGYEADAPFAAEGAQYAAAGIPFYVCPGTSSWCSLAGRTDNALGNLRNAAENGLRHGAVGFLNTDWGDRGHWQTLPVSFLGFAAGAAYSWALAANVDRDLTPALSRHAFDDPTGTVGRVAYELGNVYRKLPHIGNGSALFWALQLPAAALRPAGGETRRGSASAVAGATPEQVADALAAIDAAVAPLPEHRMGRPDAALIERELRNTARLMRHACNRLLWLQDAQAADAARRELDRDIEAISAEYRELWLARNRPGGLADSAARLDVTRADYASAT